MLFIYFIEIWILIGTFIFFSLESIFRVLKFVLLPKIPSLKDSFFFQSLLSASKFTVSTILSAVISMIVFIFVQPYLTPLVAMAEFLAGSLKAFFSTLFSPLP